MKEFKFSKPLKDEEWQTTSQYILPNGEKTDNKPEYMTQLIGNLLVEKTHPRIILRGKLDRFQSELTLIIHQARKENHSEQLINQLKELLEYSMLILKHEVLNTSIPEDTLLSWSAEEIRERSHNPIKYFGLKQMILVDDTFDSIVLTLNILRASIREIEIVAVQAYQTERTDIIQALNRMSSCFHILMYQEITRNQSLL